MAENESHLLCNIGIAGSGRMANFLVSAFKKCGVPVKLIFSRNQETMERIANTYQLIIYNQSSNLHPAVDIWFLAVPDDAITAVGMQLHQNYPKSLFVHCSGAFDTSKLIDFHPNSACFYPLQTLSGDLPPDIDQIPILIFANEKHNVQLLSQIAQKISEKVILTQESDRLVVHLAAVFANNFTNLMLRMSKEVLDSRGLPLSLLERLLQETVEKIKRMGPDEAQTGPAVRGDMHTLAQHRAWLEKNNPALLAVYDLCTHKIIEKTNEK